MRTYEQGVDDVASKQAAYGKVASFTWGVAQENAEELRGVYTFASTQRLSFKVPKTDTEYMKGITDTVNKLTGGSASQLEQSIGNISDKITDTFKGVPVIGLIAEAGIFPLLLFFGIVVGGVVWLWRKFSKRKRRVRRRRRR